MKFTETKLKGAYYIDMEPIEEERGFFARTFCEKEFAKHGLVTDFVQANASKSMIQYTLRGMHFQVDGSEEVKVMRCVKGKIQDVIIDLRPTSDTYCQHISVELSEENKRMLYVPTGFAHGFLTLVPDCEVAYMVSNYYSPENERGLRWNDDAFGIKWLGNPAVISPKDEVHTDFKKGVYFNK
jgi:dTDP-4-dehydrorhamnose 3,5-epimerase